MRWGFSVWAKSEQQMLGVESEKVPAKCSQLLLKEKVNATDKAEDARR